MTDRACKQICDEVSLAAPASLYVHVPFCRRKCAYCDFYSLPASRDAADAYLPALRAELRARAGRLATPLASVYVGGGTPTALGARRLRALLADLRPLTDGRTEFTVEANPGTVTPAVARALAEGGANRVALGAQSFEPAELKTLRRLHSPCEVAEAVGALRAAGIENIGLDLIYGIPGQSLRSWRASLEAACALGPAHVSAYALTFEKGTPLRNDLERGRVAEMDDSLQKECYFEAVEFLGRAGLEHYEISNFARAGRQCRHNLTYWRNLPYLGVGPAAASYVGGVRRTNAPDLAGYVRAMSGPEQTPPPGEEEKVALPLAMAETMMLGLRLMEGVDRPAFARRFGRDPAEVFPRSLRLHQEWGTIVVTASRVRLDPRGLFVSDAVLADIVTEGRATEAS